MPFWGLSEHLFSLFCHTLFCFGCIFSKTLFFVFLTAMKMCTRPFFIKTMSSFIYGENRVNSLLFLLLCYLSRNGVILIRWLTHNNELKKKKRTSQIKSILFHIHQRAKKKKNRRERMKQRNTLEPALMDLSK